MKTYNLKCFGKSEQFGNEVLVVKDELSEVVNRLNFAKITNKTACVFMEQENNNLILDYYYPQKRSPLCIHATLAASYIYFKDNPNIDSTTIITSMDMQKIIAEKTINGNIFLTLQKQYIDDSTYNEINNELIAKLLNLDKLSCIKDHYIESCGSPKLFVELADLNILSQLSPDLSLINEWNNKIKLNGLYVYTYFKENIYLSRNFNHLDPKFEDSATGVAAAAMTLYLKQNLQIHQGNFINNECVIYTNFINSVTVQVGGVVNYIN